MNARECIAGALFDFSGSGQGVDDMLADIAFAQADAILANFADKGFRLIAPGKLDAETLERAAGVAENTDPHWPDNGERIATAIRSLAGRAALEGGDNA